MSFTCRENRAQQIRVQVQAVSAVKVARHHNRPMPFTKFTRAAFRLCEATAVPRNRKGACRSMSGTAAPWREHKSCPAQTAEVQKWAKMYKVHWDILRYKLWPDSRFIYCNLASQMIVPPVLWTFFCQLDQRVWANQDWILLVCEMNSWWDRWEGSLAPSTRHEEQVRLWKLSVVFWIYMRHRCHIISSQPVPTRDVSPWPNSARP